MNYKYLIIYLIPCLFFTCKTNDREKSMSENGYNDTSVKVIPKEDSIPFNNLNNTLFVDKKTDSIDDDKLKLEYLTENKFINNKYPFWGEKTSLVNIVKKADSINKSLDGCGYILEDSYEIWYYRNCEIEVSNTDYVFTKIDFEHSNFTLHYESIVFSKNYTLEEFKKDFPVSYKENKFSEDENLIKIRVLVHELADGSYIFTFKDNKLIEILNFFPC